MLVTRFAVAFSQPSSYYIQVRHSYRKSLSFKRCVGRAVRFKWYEGVLASWGGVRLSPLGTSATNWPIVPALRGRWWVWSTQWNENWQGKPKYSEKTCPSATLSTTNPTWPDLGHCGGKPATNHLSYGTASCEGLLWLSGTVQWWLAFIKHDSHLQGISV
jgi:hypothetical protein